MFWMVSEDNGWSNILSQEIFPYAGCSSVTPVAPPISSPVSAPVAPPGPPSTPVAPPVSSPVAPPVSSPIFNPEPPFCPSGYSGKYPSDNCHSFHHCTDGVVTSASIDCPSGLLFNTPAGYCD